MSWRTLAVVALLVVAGCAGFSADSTPSTDDATDTEPETTTVAETGAPTTTVEATTEDVTRVYVTDAENGTELGNVTVEIADTQEERYTGLSEHESLGEDEGMLFVYDEEGHHTYVMRSMDFPIDIIFVGANGRITAIHHAEVEEDNDDLTGYDGVGQWVLEVPYNWTTERGVEVGDRVRIEN